MSDIENNREEIIVLEKRIGRIEVSVQIPATRELIVADAFTRGWAQTAAEASANESTPE